MRCRDELSTLYMPQIEQFGIALHPLGRCDDVLVGTVSNEAADAMACVQRLGSYGVMTSHRIHMKRDLPFYEHGITGLCVSTLSADSLALCPVAQPRSARDAGNVAVFGQDRYERMSPLKAGSAQDAISITLLPAWFDRWDEEHRRAAWSIIDSVGETCPAETGQALDALLRAVSPVFGGRAAGTGALHAQAMRIAAEVLAWHEAREEAEAAAGTLGQARLARAARRHVDRHLAEALSLDALARDLLTSRTRLCAAFKRETGESLGGYIKRMRMERAQSLLAVPGLPVGEVAHLVGYPRISSFTVAFERACGCSPTAWRTQMT